MGLLLTVVQDLIKLVWRIWKALLLALAVFCFLLVRVGISGPTSTLGLFHTDMNPNNLEP